jgi:SAM-dependent methyltransferase
MVANPGWTAPETRAPHDGARRRAVPEVDVAPRGAHIETVSTREHWDGVYGRKAADQVSWYRPHLERSLGLIEGANLGRGAAIIDVGGGTSTLVDDLVVRGFTNVTVLDVSPSAIEATRTRLGARARLVRWIKADVTRAPFEPDAYDFWHDRAVFHFLRHEEERRRYVAAVRRAVKPGGHVLVATFGPEGPERCSGLDVVRYDPNALHAQFGRDFEKVHSATELHQTPWGQEQQFIYCLCRVSPSPARA